MIQGYGVLLKEILSKIQFNNYRGQSPLFLLFITPSALLTIFNGKHFVSCEKTYTFATDS